MAKPQQSEWTVEDFLTWEAQQLRRFEFVDGEARMMTGGTQAHAFICANILTILKQRLRGTDCRPFGSDLRIICANGNVRYPDVLVDCGKLEPKSHNASEPTVIFEVLSQSTLWFDQTRKLQDYETVKSVVHYVCVSQETTRVIVWSRSGDHLVMSDQLSDLGDVIEVSGVEMTLEEIYEGIG